MVASAEDWRSESVTNAEVKVDVCEGTGSFRVSTALPSVFEEAIYRPGRTGRVNRVLCACQSLFCRHPPRAC